jgi:hypothetical protein
MLRFLDDLYVFGTFNARASPHILLYLNPRTPLPPKRSGGGGRGGSGSGSGSGGKQRRHSTGGEGLGDRGAAAVATGASAGGQGRDAGGATAAAHAAATPPPSPAVPAAASAAGSKPIVPGSSPASRFRLPLAGSPAANAGTGMVGQAPSPRSARSGGAASPLVLVPPPAHARGLAARANSQGDLRRPGAASAGSNAAAALPLRRSGTRLPPRLAAAARTGAGSSGVMLEPTVQPFPRGDAFLLD